MSQSTWYRHCKKLGFTTERKPKKKVKTKISVRAKKVNQIWHMDLSYFTTTDNIRHYIYTVVDNFSRKIVAYDVATELSAKMRLDSLKRAIKDIFNVDIKPKPNLDLIVDGGSENNNETIHEFIRNAHVNIDEKIALKDVIFSYAMVEAPYRILKSRYFKDKEISSNNIQQELDYFVNDYNNNRPHYAHTLYTPQEIYDQPELKDVKPKLDKINQDRIEANRNFCCKEIQ